MGCDMDTVTIFVMICIGNLVNSVLVYTYNRGHFSETIRFHFYSQVLFTAAFALFVFEDFMDIPVVMFMANLCVLLGCTNGVFAIMTLTGIYTRAIRRKIIAYVAFIIIVHIGMALLGGNPNYRVVFGTAGLSLLWIFTAYFLLKQKNKSLLQTCIGALAVIVVVSLGVRIRDALDFSVDYLLFAPGTGHTATFISFYAFMILSGSGVLLLAKEKDDERIQFYATRDELTGLYNRRHFFQEVEKGFALANRKKLPYSILMLDIDFFKKINDTYGHQKGDQVLQEFAKILQHELRQYDIVGRIGGEEFLIYLHDVDKEAAFAAADRLRSLVEQTEAARIRFTTSIGVYSVDPNDGEAKELDEIYRLSDLALYEAKNTGRNRVVQNLLAQGVGT